MVRLELTVSNLRKSFGAKRVLDGVSFTARSGAAMGLLGRNGAGKTTTIRILMNVFPADSGQVLLDGEPVNYDRVALGYLPEERGMYPKKRVTDQLVYFGELKGMRKKEARLAAGRWLERLNMEEYRNQQLSALSKGNQQKIQLITALMHDPAIVILDEPFSGLDPVNAELLKGVVREEIARDKLVLFSSHQMHYIEEFCDDIVIIRGGKVAIAGNLREIKGGYLRDKLIVRSRSAEKIAKELNKRCRLTGPDELIIQLAYTGEKDEIMRRVLYQYDVDEMRVFEPSLNDIFIEYAGGDDSDEKV